MCQKTKGYRFGGGGVGKEKLDQFCSNLMSDKQKCTSLGSRFTILENINRILVIFGSSQEPRLIIQITFGDLILALLWTDLQDIRGTSTSSQALFRQQSLITQILNAYTGLALGRLHAMDELKSQDYKLLTSE